MFDRASMKLGLDKAILQRTDANSAYGDATGANESEGSKVSGISKTEIEDLLKKGAYAAFMDDNEANDEGDIDQILTRRTQVIRHDNSQEKSSIFSKATFATSEGSCELMVDINDPEFWDKVAKKAELNVAELPKAPDLIIDTARMTKQVQRFGDQFVDEAEPEGDVSFDPSLTDYAQQTTMYNEKRTRQINQNYGRRQIAFAWNVIEERFGFESLLPCVIQFVLTCNAADADVVEDVKNMMQLDEIPDIETADLSAPYKGATK
ncbi:choline dehydrogenase 6 [Physocladia obscura]|uniref:Choline dehydrogenase 6 n=1 Tax=Physocladia obscura TaxID=109957 RepID=A0AAD5T9J2_9FUNG|nr:choline dehydrogenase 6 [Physocladia obscura]